LLEGDLPAGFLGGGLGVIKVGIPVLAI